MSLLFQELDHRQTSIGAVSLRRRRDLVLGIDIFEIMLGDEHLMSSLFTTSEIALARLGLAAQPAGCLDVAVGGLGLGYTAKAVLDDARVKSLTIVEFLQPVIDWHHQGLLPMGRDLVRDTRCSLVQGDFFALAASGAGLDPSAPGRRFHAILVDIDHSPEALLDARSTAFYRPEGLRRLASHLHPGGIFGLWSNDPPDPAFTDRLSGVFAAAWAEPVSFRHPHQDRCFTQTVYLARNAARETQA